MMVIQDMDCTIIIIGIGTVMGVATETLSVILEFVGAIKDIFLHMDPVGTTGMSMKEVETSYVHHQILIHLFHVQLILPARKLILTWSA